MENFAIKGAILRIVSCKSVGPLPNIVIVTKVEWMILCMLDIDGLIFVLF